MAPDDARAKTSVEPDVHMVGERDHGASPRTFPHPPQMTLDHGARRLFPKDITGALTADRQQVDVQWRSGVLVIDEPPFNGGQDLGPDPFTMVLAGLVGCTLTTLRMYIHRKGWDIDDIRVSVNMGQRGEPLRTTIWRTVVVGQSITDAQRERLLYIARHCPVARLLEGEIVIDTTLGGEVHAEPQTV